MNTLKWEWRHRLARFDSDEEVLAAARDEWRPVCEGLTLREISARLRCHPEVVRANLRCVRPDPVFALRAILALRLSSPRSADE